jgi:hypothetical protein
MSKQGKLRKDQLDLQPGDKVRLHRRLGHRPLGIVFTVKSRFVSSFDRVEYEVEEAKIRYGLYKKYWEVVEEPMTAEEIKNAEVLPDADDVREFFK